MIEYSRIPPEFQRLSPPLVTNMRGRRPRVSLRMCSENGVSRQEGLCVTRCLTYMNLKPCLQTTLLLYAPGPAAIRLRRSGVLQEAFCRGAAVEGLKES